MTICSDHMTDHLTYLCHLVRELHVVKYPEDNLEEIFPPVLLKRATIALHDLKHHSQPSADQSKHYYELFGNFGRNCIKLNNATNMNVHSCNSL